MDIKVVGVVGSGVIGQGVAQNLAQRGFQVTLIDISQKILEHAKGEIQKNVRFGGFFEKVKKNKNPDNVLDRITFSTDYQMLKEAEFVIENVTEKWKIKERVYKQLDEICSDHCVFAANTSTFSITRLASATNRASKVIGIHFMNPVPMKSMVELIRGYHTSDKTLQIAKDVLAKMGKEWILVSDSPGFVSNRVLMLTINETVFLLQDGVASVEEVDRIFKTCFGHKMGPLETADLIGLDTILFSLESLYESFQDNKYRPCPLIRKMVDAGLYGRKSGQGFYTY